MYAFYDQKREQQERNTFYKRLYDLMEVLKAKNLKPWMNPGVVFRETATRDAKFIEWSVFRFTEARISSRKDSTC